MSLDFDTIMFIIISYLKNKTADL